MEKRYSAVNYSPHWHLQPWCLEDRMQCSQVCRSIVAKCVFIWGASFTTHLPSSFLGKCMLNPLLLESLQNCLNDKEKKTSQYILLWQNYWFKSHTIAQYYLKVNGRKMSLHPNRAKLICQGSVMMCLFPHWGVYIFQEDTTVYLQVKSALKWEFEEIFPFQMVGLILWGPESHFCT